jgi:hypothetical protein
LILLIVLLIGLALLKDRIVKGLIEHRIEAGTGMDVKIRGFELGLTHPVVTIEDAQLFNTAEFGGSPLVDLKELHLECDARDLASRRLHLKLLRLNVGEVNIVESRDGRTNIVDLLAHLEEKMPKPEKESTNGGMVFSGIDILNLSFGTVKYTSLKRPDQSREFEINLKNEIVTNVTSEADLNALVLKVMFRQGITMFLSDGKKRHAPNQEAAVSPEAEDLKNRGALTPKTAK